MRELIEVTKNKTHKVVYGASFSVRNLSTGEVVAVGALDSLSWDSCIFEEEIESFIEKLRNGNCWKHTKEEESL